MKFGELKMTANMPKENEAVINISEDDFAADVDKLLESQGISEFEHDDEQEKIRTMEDLMKVGDDDDIKIEGAENADKVLAEGNKKLAQEKMKKLQEQEDKNIIAFREVVQRAARSWGASEQNTKAVITELSKQMRDNGIASVFTTAEFVSEERVNKAVEEIAARDAKDNPESQTTN